MENIKYNIVTLKNGKSYFVLEEVSDNFNTYNLILNVEDENDVKIVLQEVKNGKTVFTPLEDKDLLKTLSPLFEERIKIKQSNIK